MPEYYTMRACFDICGDNDIPFVEGLYNDEHTLTKKIAIDHHHSPSIEAALSDKWQIKRAEPRVYDIENFINKYEKTESQRSFVRLADQNGQLREWLRREQVELREAVKNYRQLMETGAEVPIEHCERVNKAIENLKPPYETKS
jgi:hypothetical protein